MISPHWGQARGRPGVNDSRRLPPGHAVHAASSCHGQVPDGRAYTVDTYAYGGRTLVQHYVVQGMGHAWSGSQSDLPFTDPKGPDAGAGQLRRTMHATAPRTASQGGRRAQEVLPMVANAQGWAWCPLDWALLAHI